MAGRTRPLELNQKLSNYVPPHFNVAYDMDRFGVEIELEGHKVMSDIVEINNYWKQVKDGSLRPRPEAIEYVSRYPLPLEDTKISLTSLFKYLNKGPGVKVLPSYRTSIHVHVNCMNETLRTVANYICLAIIFDELLVSQNGQTRVGNNFCLRTRDAEGQIADLINSVQVFGSFTSMDHHYRYSSTNLASLAKYGTIEFRSLECTTDFDRVWHWINTLQTLKEAARKYSDPREIIGKFSQKGALGFIMANLGEYGLKYAGVPGYGEMLRNGMRLAQDFAFCSEWRLHEGKMLSPKPKKKYYDADPVAWNLQDFQGLYNPPPAPGAAGAWGVYAQQAIAPNDAGMEAYLNEAQHFGLDIPPIAPMHAVPVEVDGWGDPVPHDDDDDNEDEADDEDL